MTRILLAFLLLPTAAAAQSGIGGMIGSGYSSSRISTNTPIGWDRFNAGNLTGGASFKAWRVVGLSAGESSFYSVNIPPNPIFVVDPRIPSGCRNSSNGQFATAVSCQPTKVSLRAGAWLYDLNAVLWPIPLMVGAGYRDGGSKATSGAYLSAGYARPIPRINGLWFARALGGKSVRQFQVGITAYWNPR